MKQFFLVGLVGLVMGCGARGPPRPPRLQTVHQTPALNSTSNELFPTSLSEKAITPSQSDQECSSCPGAKNE